MMHILNIYPPFRWRWPYRDGLLLSRRWCGRGCAQ